MTMTTAEADKILSVNFAPWVLDLGLRVEAVGDDRAILRLPWSDRLSREGGGSHVGRRCQHPSLRSAQAPETQGTIEGVRPRR